MSGWINLGERGSIALTKTTLGTLIIIGGHEDKAGDRVILTEVAQRARKDAGRLVVITVATQVPEEVAAEYRTVFGELGVKHVDVLDVRTRDEAHESAVIDKVKDARVVFFTGGDQLRITSQLGDSPVFQSLLDTYHSGGTIVGTSAGAAAMPGTMLISGPGDESSKLTSLGMAPGLGLMPDVVIDSHFAERGRIGRLLGAVAQNPRNLGIGIDEDTAIVVDRGTCFEVLGSGAVYVVDGTQISYSSLSETNADGVISIDDVRLHVLGAGDQYDLTARRPVRRAMRTKRSD